jgi:hypothetical protein
MTKIRPAAPPPPRHTTRSQRRPGRRQAPGHPDICRICPHPPQTPCASPGFPDDLMSPGFPGVGLPDSGHATGWILLARSSYSIGLNMPSDEGQPRRLRRDRSRRARRGGRRPRLRCGRPGACPRARPAGSIPALGRLAVTPAARAGAPLRTSQHHHDSRAAPVVTVRHRQKPCDPVSTRDRVPVRARAPGPAGVFAPAALAGRAGSSSCRAVSRQHGSAPRAFRDRLAKGRWRARPRPWRGAACTTRRSRWRRAL